MKRIDSIKQKKDGERYMSRLVPAQHYISSHYIKLIYLIYQLAQQAYIICCMTAIYIVTL